MKITTRQKIINKAVELFNKSGFASITLFEIAGELNMTRGNLTYHFKDKDVLLKAISDEFWSTLDVEKNKRRLLPSFENMHNEVQLFYQFQRKYSFIFLDYQVLNHPAVKKQFREMTKQNVKEMEVTIAFAISSGNMNSEPFEGIYHNLAFSTWMVSFYWLHQQIFHGEKPEKSNVEGEMKIWSMLLPHLTEKGIKSFRKFFGDDYLKKMGKSFNSDLEKYVGF
ncbi:MAG: TetR/AcrR family transcriptional regulator [Saprospiraceae bacterium]|nr:TetR/AcrR family transcriptional regulator [Saprospiraceae bacterium]